MSRTRPERLARIGGFAVAVLEQIRRESVESPGDGASIYDAMPVGGVQPPADFKKRFRRLALDDAGESSREPRD
ncbi:MAG TPA: hypothetical protein VKC55_04575, partial [Actinomycetota bacterium]|nr:hypothetical protein [Actinomycetota bacterium]